MHATIFLHNPYRHKRWTTVTKMKTVPTAAAFLLTALLLCLPKTAFAQTCEAPGGTPPGFRPSFAWQDHFFALTRLGNHWMPNFGDGDSMTNPFWLDKGTAFPFGSEGFRETWYVARDQMANTAPFYRLYSPNFQDHMDAKDPDPAPSLGFSQELVHGYAFTTSLPGTAPLTRYIKGSIFDHRTWMNSSAPAGYSTGVAWTNRRGYPRYGNLLDQCSVISDGLALGHTLQNATFRVRYNPIWGNAIGEITHLPTGKQLVSHSIGDMVNAAVFYGGPVGGPLLNPTLSGGADCWDYGNTRRWAGSPVISTSSGGTTQKWFETITRPLNFCHNDFQGNDPWSPLAWRGLFRIRTTVGCRLASTNYADVIQKKFEVTKDADAPFTDNPLNIASGGWLLLGPFGDCNLKNIRVDVINMSTGAIESTQFPGCHDSIVLPSGTARKAFRVTSADNTFALGLGNIPSVAQMSLTFRCNFGCPVAFQKLVWSVFKFYNVTSSSWVGDSVYFVAGSPSTVLNRLTQINSDNGLCTS